VPNPANESAVIPINIAQAGNYTATVLNTAGKIVSQSTVPFENGGSHVRPTSVRHLPHGQYVMRIRRDGVEACAPFIIAC